MSLLILSKLQHDPITTSGQVMDICEEFWKITTEQPTMAAKYQERFIEMLKDPDNWQLARMVVWELRDSDTASAKNDIQREVMEQLQQMHGKKENASRRLAARECLFNEEKDRIQEIIIYRFGVMLYNTGKLNPTQREEVLKWIDARPRRAETSHLFEPQDKTRQ